MRKKSPIVINVPHSSLLIPEEEMQFFERPRLIRELVAMTDHCCVDLFDTGHIMTDTIHILRIWLRKGCVDMEDV